MPNRISAKMIIATQYRFSEMFKDTGRRGGFFPILTKLKEKQMWVSQVESKNMGRTSSVGYLQYAHPYLTNQNETLNDLKKVSGIDDLTLEHHPVQTGRQSFRQGNESHANSRTLAWNIRAPQDIAAEVQRYLFEHWAKIQANTMSIKLPEGSTLRKFLFIPNSPVLMDANQRNIFIRDQNTFRHNYKAVTLLNTKTVDEEFELNEEECKEIGISCKGCSRRRMRLRKIMKTWKGTNREKAIWDIERGIEDRYHIVVYVENVDGVRREAHNLLKMLRGREDFEDIAGDWRARVEGGDLIPTTNEYKNLLQSTAIRIEEDDTKEEKSKPERPRKKTEKKQENPWKWEFNVREVIAKPSTVEDGPSTMTVDTESVITLTYRDDKGDDQSVQMTKKDMNIYNAIMQGVSRQIKEQEAKTVKQQEKSMKVIEDITAKVQETSDNIKERQDKNEEIVKSLKKEVKQQQQKIEQMDKNQGRRIEECQESVRSDIAELKELMLTMSGISTKTTQKRSREDNQAQSVKVPESPTKKPMRNTQKKKYREIPVQIKQELIEKAASKKEKKKEKKETNKDVEMIDLSKEEANKDTYKMRATTVQKRPTSNVVLTPLGKPEQTLGVEKSRSNSAMRGRNDKSKSQSGRTSSLSRIMKAAGGSIGKRYHQRQES